MAWQGWRPGCPWIRESCPYIKLKGLSSNRDEPEEWERLPSDGKMLRIAALQKLSPEQMLMRVLQPCLPHSNQIRGDQQHG